MGGVERKFTTGSQSAAFAAPVQKCCIYSTSSNMSLQHDLELPEASMLIMPLVVDNTFFPSKGAPS